MAETNFPQIPRNVWWGVRSLIDRRPNGKVDQSFLAADLNVQATAAKAYINELTKVGILDEEGKPTDLAQKWRSSETYDDAVEELLKRNYPEALLALAPRDSLERSKIVTWFSNQGLGSGTANNKAATYLLIASAEPGEQSSALPSSRTRSQATQKEISKHSNTTKPSIGSQHEDISQPNERDRSAATGGAIPLNLNIQIHISADASNEQIEKIFESMSRYLRENPTS